MLLAWEWVSLHLVFFIVNVENAEELNLCIIHSLELIYYITEVRKMLFVYKCLDDSCVRCTWCVV